MLHVKMERQRDLAFEVANVAHVLGTRLCSRYSTHSRPAQHGVIIRRSCHRLPADNKSWTNEVAEPCQLAGLSHTLCHSGSSRQRVARAPPVAREPARG
jgi:hypothetical protein